jgi:hypothetical protein
MIERANGKRLKSDCISYIAMLISLLVDLLISVFEWLIYVPENEL